MHSMDAIIDNKKVGFSPINDCDKQIPIALLCYTGECYTLYAHHRSMALYCPLFFAIFVLSLLKKKRYLPFGEMKNMGSLL